MIRNLDVFLWNRKVGSLVAYKERYTEKVCFYFDRDFLISRGDLLELAKRYNIKGRIPSWKKLSALSPIVTVHSAVLAGCREFVVELSGLVQRANIATFRLAEVPPHFGSHLPQRIAEDGVVPRP